MESIGVMKIKPKFMILCTIVMILGILIARFTCQIDITSYLILTMLLSSLTIPPFIWMIINSNKKSQLVIPKLFAYSFVIGVLGSILFIMLLLFRPDGCAESLPRSIGTNSIVLPNQKGGDISG
jgi:hypothetical protein